MKGRLIKFSFVSTSPSETLLAIPETFQYSKKTKTIEPLMEFPGYVDKEWSFLRLSNDTKSNSCDLLLLCDEKSK